MNKIPTAAQNKIANATMSAQGHLGNPLLTEDDRAALGRVRMDMAAAVNRGDPQLAYIQTHHRLASLTAHIEALTKASKTVPMADRRDILARIEILDHTKTALMLSRDALKAHAPDEIEEEQDEAEEVTDEADEAAVGDKEQAVPEHDETDNRDPGDEA